MLTLGIHDGHTSTACLMEDGEVISCISEERIVREKEWTGFPAMLGHRVVTLHPKVHGSLLCLRDDPEHRPTSRSTPCTG